MQLRGHVRQYTAPRLCRAGSLRARRASFASAGLTIVESTVAIAIIGVIASSSIATMTSLNRLAVSTRIMTSVREIVQRNIETAIGSPFSSTNVPTILSFATNAVWDDDGGGDNLETIYVSRDGTMTIKGTLVRTVTAEPNSTGADIRRVTFTLSYTLYGRALSYQMTTIRAIDP